MGNQDRDNPDRTQIREETHMRILLGALAATMLAVVGAQAAEAEGQVKSVDREKLTITLDDGKSYKLPGEFDLEAIREGMEVLLAYEKINGENVIMDMDLSE